MNINCIGPLKYPKPNKIPNRLIYGSNSQYRMVDLLTGSYLGKLKVTPTELKNNTFYKNKEPIKSLYINDLWIVPFFRRKNAGSEFVKFAKKLSYKEGCKGRLHLLAYNYDNPYQAPHKFWRKLGFASASEKENKILDFIIENDIDVPPDMCQGTFMFK